MFVGGGSREAGTDTDVVCWRMLAADVLEASSGKPKMKSGGEWSSKNCEESRLSWLTISGRGQYSPVNSVQGHIFHGRTECFRKNFRRARWRPIHENRENYMRLENFALYGIPDKVWNM